MAAPFGNKNATKNRPWRDAIDRALAKKSRVDKIEALDIIAEKLIDTAMAGPNYEKGDPWLSAVSELSDRLDGRPNQQIQAVDEEGRTLAIALVAYHDSAQLQAANVPASDADSVGLRH